VDIKQIKEQGSALFSKRMQLLSLWQAISENFYPERADFTVVRNLGREFANNLMTSYPVMARRDLGNALGSMLRPTSKEWKHIRTRNYEDVDRDGRAWLEKATKVMTRAMYDKNTQFTRATKEGDHDFAAFGQCCIQLTLNRQANGLLYRCWHLRDVAWRENDEGVIDTIYRKWKPAAIDLVQLFPKTVHAKVKEAVEKTPHKEIDVWHIILAAENYQSVGGKEIKTPFVSIYYDVENDTVMEEVGVKDKQYTIPRWSTVSGSQYAYSPATVCGLPDARLIQSMTRTLMEAGEKAVTPPMLATQEAIRSDISLYAGGITWVDADYDERLGEVLRPISQRTDGIPLGMEMMRDTRVMISEAFFLNKLALPSPGSDMTAYEVGQRVQEYIRQAMPLFEPMEAEYNAPLCEMTFDILMRSGAFGSPFELPDSIRGQEIEFFFESPLHDAVEREKGQRFLEAQSMLAQAVNLDPSSAFLVDAKTALRDVLNGIGVPTAWTRSEADVQALVDKQEQQVQTQQLLANMQAGAGVAKDLGAAGLGGQSTVNRQDFRQ
jgi:hypothetical protein